MGTGWAWGRVCASGGPWLAGIANERTGCGSKTQFSAAGSTGGGVGSRAWGMGIEIGAGTMDDGDTTGLGSGLASACTGLVGAGTGLVGAGTGRVAPSTLGRRS